MRKKRYYKDKVKSMKQKILLVLIFFASLILLLIPAEKTQQKEDETMTEETRAIFISYIELSQYLHKKDVAVMKNTIDDMIVQMKDFGLNTILLQVRSFSDAIYPSTIFPSSRMIVETEGDPLPMDVLDYFLQAAHQNKMTLHAWINPYRIRNEKDKANISPTNPAFRYANTNLVKEIPGLGIFYNPAEAEVEDLIVKGIKEILDNYEVDGILFDDYFYPDETIDQENYQAALQENKHLTLQEYRLSVTSSLIKKVYRSVKKKDQRLKFGISPEGNIDNNYTTNYIDTKKFAREKGYVDYLMPQIYFGFLNEARPFTETMKEWNNMITNESVSLLPALAFYKTGTIDTYAKKGQEEWLLYNNIIAREVLASRDFSQYDGFAIYRFSSLFEENLSQQSFLEKENLKNVLRKN